MGFALQDALGALETPGGRLKPGEKVETPLTDVINRNLKVALANSSRNNVSEMQAASGSPELGKSTEKEVKMKELHNISCLQFSQVCGLVPYVFKDSLQSSFGPVLKSSSGLLIRTMMK